MLLKTAAAGFLLSALASNCYACGGADVVDEAAFWAILLVMIPASALPLAGVLAGGLGRSGRTSLWFGAYALTSILCFAISVGGSPGERIQATLVILAAIALLLPTLHYLWLACGASPRRRGEGTI